MVALFLPYFTHCVPKEPPWREIFRLRSGQALGPYTWHAFFSSDSLARSLSEISDRHEEVLV